MALVCVLCYRGIRISESGKLFVESGILGFGIRIQLTIGIQNPSSTDKDWDPVPGIRNPRVESSIDVLSEFHVWWENPLTIFYVRLNRPESCLKQSKVITVLSNTNNGSHSFAFSLADLLLIFDFRPTSPPRNKTSESFEVFGPPHIHPDLLREVYSILEQLLPAVQRNLYEDVDGQKAADSNSPDHEESPLLPSSVKMHRKAVTSDKNIILIRNHFDRADLVNLSSEIDFDLKYSDSAFINKSNGMITESRAYFSEELNFGEPIHSNSSSDVRSLKVAMTSLVTLIELPNYFEQAESERVKVHLFVSLSLPKSKSTFSVKETRKVQTGRAVSNLTLSPSETPLANQTYNSTNSSSILLTRSRRSTNLAFDYSSTLFQKKVLGIMVKVTARYKVQEGVSVRETVVLHIGKFDRKLIDKEYPWSQLQRQQPSRNSYSWSTSIVSAFSLYWYTFIQRVLTKLSFNI